MTDASYPRVCNRLVQSKATQMDTESEAHCRVDNGHSKKQRHEHPVVRRDQSRDVFTLKLRHHGVVLEVQS